MDKVKQIGKILLKIVFFSIEKIRLKSELNSTEIKSGKTFKH